MTDIVKSAYMIDPSDGLTLVRREEAGQGDIDKEYWQRVNQVFRHQSHVVMFTNHLSLGRKCFECCQNV